MGFFEVRVVDELLEDFKRHLDNENTRYRMSTNSIEVEFFDSKNSEAISLISDFYESKGLTLSNKVIAFDGHTIYCCSFDGLLASFLKLYYGNDVLNEVSESVTNTINTYPYLMSCDDCSFSVTLDGDRLRIEYFGDISSREQQEITEGLGIGIERPALSLISVVAGEYSSDPLVKEYLRNYIDVYFEN